MPSPAPPVLWRPDTDRVQRANLTRFARWLADRSGLAFDGYEQLWRWSVSDIQQFWLSIVEHYDVRCHSPHQAVIGRRAMPGTEWFPGATLNYAEHVFRGRDPEAVAIRHCGELRELGEMTWGEFERLTAQIAAALHADGVRAGDRVAAFMPNIPETAAAFLACASLGAVWSSASPDFGARGAADRFAQIQPTVLFAVDGYRYGGRDFDRREVIADLQARLPTLQRTVLLRYLNPDADPAPLTNTVTFEQFTRQAAGQPTLQFTAVPFSHPLWIVYSSGTTGPPKPIVHGHGGILLEQLKYQHLHLDAQADDRVFWFTTTGWMMWNFLIGCLLTPASVVLYDGNPGHPSTGRLWDLIQQAGITIFGTSAAYIAACMKAEVAPAAGRDLTRLRTVGVTGSPLTPEGFEWLHRHLPAGTWPFSMSGGTDLCTAFVAGVPTLPVHTGELQAPALGAHVQAFDPDGRPLTGQVGELVLTEPMPSMPLFFWGDDDGSRYRHTYFDTYPGVWRHGDWITITDRGTSVISGRSDSTINRGGIRIGTAEIYRAVLALDDVHDALVVDLSDSGDNGQMMLFVVLADGTLLDDQLTGRIRRHVRETCTPRHVPDVIEQITEVPRTRTGKILEVPVKRILLGDPPEQAVSRDALTNPHALDWFITRAAEHAAHHSS